MSLPSSDRAMTILLVEDDDGDAKGVRRAFSHSTAPLPTRIIRAVDGVEALEHMRGLNGREQLKQPFLMLSDLNLPRMDGIELLKTMRADPELRSIVAFMLTTSKRDEDMVEAYKLNVAGYISKERAGNDFMLLSTLIDQYWHVVDLPRDC